MTRWLIAALATTALSAPALADGFRDEYTAAPTGPVSIAEIAIGEELAGEADELGEREITRLTGMLHDDIARELASMSWLAGEGAMGGTTLFVTLEDADPNRPTFAQMRGNPSLDYRSHSVGGAEISAELRDAAGNVVATYHYEWTSNDIRFAAHAGTWTDATRVFDRFARQLGDSLAEHAETGM